MADVLVLFASKGDEAAFGAAIDFLDKNNISYDFRLASAHKTPKDVEKILKKKYKVIITGAGLAAALPGVVAANVLCPVIGVPCSGNLEGLDALLAILQMPPGIPVLTTGVNKGEIAANSALMTLRKHEGVVLAGERGGAMKKAEELLEKFGVPLSYSPPKKNILTIFFLPANEKPKKMAGLTIFCPLIDPKNDKAGLAIALLKNTAEGLWVGLNNGTNAAIAAVEILNMNGEYTNKLIAYRKGQAEKVRAYSR